jgi:hypothetical protein
MKLVNLILISILSLTFISSPGYSQSPKKAESVGLFNFEETEPAWLLEREALFHWNDSVDQFVSCYIIDKGIIIYSVRTYDAKGGIGNDDVPSTYVPKNKIADMQGLIEQASTTDLVDSHSTGLKINKLMRVTYTARYSPSQYYQLRDTFYKNGEVDADYARNSDAANKLIQYLDDNCKSLSEYAKGMETKSEESGK